MRKILVLFIAVCAVCLVFSLGAGLFTSVPTAQASAPIAYTVTFSAGANGTLGATVGSVAIATGDHVAEGQDVVFTAAPAADYRVKEWTVNTVVAAGNTTNTLTVSSLAAATAVTVEFEAIPAPIPVTEITVTGAGGATIVANGGTLTMSATVLPDNATDAAVTWSVATLSVGTATIDTSTGVLTGTGIGTVTVTATANDASHVTGTEVITVTVTDFANTAATDTTVTFTWSGATGATSVKIQQQLHTSGTWADATMVASDAAWTVTGLTASTAYDFKLVVVAGGSNFDSNVLVNVSTTATPGPITDFANTAVTDTTATFTWTAATGASSVTIMQSIAGANTWTTAATTAGLDASSTTGTVTGLAANTASTGKYNFKLVVVSGTFDGATDGTLYVATNATTILVTNITVTGEGGATTVVSGGTLEVHAGITPGTATNPAVDWSWATLSGGTVNIGYPTGKVVLTGGAVGTVTVTATANDASHVTGTEIITVSPAPVAYESTDELTTPTVSVANGTTEADAIAALDSTVGVVGASSEAGTATIAWTIAGYNATTPGNYTATGVLTLPDGWTGTATDVTATVTVEPVSAIVTDTATKDVFLNVDSDVTGYSATDLADAVNSEIASLGGATPPTVRIKTSTTSIDTTDLSNWYVYDNYDTAYWNQYATTNGYASAAAAWEAYYSKTSTTDYTRPYCTFSESSGSIMTIASAVASGSSSILNYVQKLDEHIYSYTSSNKPAMFFYGYGSTGYTDYLFYPTTSTGEKTVDFTVDSSNVQTHTLYGAGFLVNTGIDSSGYIHGYLLFYQVGSSTTVNSVNLYKINDNVSASTFHTTSSNFGSVLSSYCGAPVTIANSPSWSSLMDIELKITPTSLIVKQKASSVSDYSTMGSGTYTLASTGYNGFGPLVQYTSHGCSQASTFTFSNLSMSFSDATASTTSAFSSLQYADYLQNSSTTKYFVNILNSASYNLDNDKGYLALMQNNDIALFTNKSVTPISAYLPAYFEDTANTSLSDLATSIAKYILGQTAGIVNSSYTGSTPSGIIADFSLKSGTEQVNGVHRDLVGGGALISATNLSVIPNGATTANLTYTLTKPDGTVLTIMPTQYTNGTTTSICTITNDKATWPAGSYTVHMSYGGTNDIPANAYFDVYEDTTVTPKPITVTATADQTKVYGTADPTFTYTVSPALETGDSFTGALSRDSGENVGTYALTQGDLSAGTNYTITFTSSDFTVTIDTDATLSYLAVGGTTVSGFAADTLSYDVELAAGTTIVPTVTATVTDIGKATAVVTPADSLPGATTVVVTAQDGTTTKTYTIHFAVAAIPPVTYTVTFDSQGGSAVAAITGITSGATVTLPAAPTKAGYTLNGWFTATTGGTAFTVATAVTADVTVYAQWTVVPPVTPYYPVTPTPSPAPAPVPVPVKKQTVLILQIGKTMFWDNSIPTKLDSPPIIKNSRTLLPIRAIIEALGGTVTWDPIAHKVTVTLGTKTVVLWIGKSVATVNGVSTPIDATDAKVVPEIINSRTMLPLRFVAENLGATVVWAAATQTITITYTP